MNCKELAYLLADYFDGSMDPRMRTELDEHIAMCEPCMHFAKTYLATCKKTTEHRKNIEYRIPEEVRMRLTSFMIAASRKFPEQMEEYRRQAERECEEKVRSFFLASLDGKLSSMATLLVETHCSVCLECKQYFDRLRNSRIADSTHPPFVQDHVTRLLESLPPEDEFFLA